MRRMARSDVPPIREAGASFILQQRIDDFSRPVRTQFRLLPTSLSTRREIPSKSIADAAD
jgi:hypothetical protein